MYSILSYLPTALVPGHPSFERYVKEHIFDPLGLNPTTYSFAAANGTGRMADGFVRSALIYSDPLAPGTPLAAPYFLPNAEEDGDYMRVGCSVVLSTATDMFRWLKMLLLNGQHPETGATVNPADVIQKVAPGVMVWEGASIMPPCLK
ncbi:hypothetical protein C8J57DRAFT_1097969 [Mycena rebaudengoi]|nr:hypothetical protein C8J57DRAFT_1097969 [Mycena rebaudengoi]